MKKIILLSIFLGLILLSCENVITTDHINIRIENTSNYEYQSVKVISFGEENDYGFLNPNQSSTYLTFERAYSYSYVEILIDNEQFFIQPIDFVGEEELENGFYTYQIHADDSSNQFGRLSLNFVVD